MLTNSITVTQELSLHTIMYFIMYYELHIYSGKLGIIQNET